MSAELEVDLTAFNIMMQRIAKALRLHGGAVLRQQARLLGDRLMAFMPPRNLQIGRKSVESAVRTQAWTPDVAQARSKWLKEAIEKYGGASQHKEFADAIKHTALGRSKPIVEPFHPHQHIRARSGRDHTPARTVNRISLNRADIKKHVSLIQKRVGRLKAGWAPLVRFGGGTPPKWIARHATSKSYVTIKPDGDDRFILVRNPGIGVKRFQRHVNDAIKSRLRDMEKHLRVMIARLQESGKL